MGRGELLELAARVGLKPLVAKRVLEKVGDATARVRTFLAEAGCEGAVSRAAAVAVEEATSRVRRRSRPE